MSASSRSRSRHSALVVRYELLRGSESVRRGAAAGAVGRRTRPHTAGARQRGIYRPERRRRWARSAAPSARLSPAWGLLLLFIASAQGFFCAATGLAQARLWAYRLTLPALRLICQVSKRRGGGSGRRRAFSGSSRRRCRSFCALFLSSVLGRLFRFCCCCVGRVYANLVVIVLIFSGCCHLGWRRWRRLRFIVKSVSHHQERAFATRRREPGSSGVGGGPPGARAAAGRACVARSRR